VNPIQKAISDLFFKIPKDIIIRAFKSSNPNFDNYSTITNNIYINVLQSRVLVDINLVGGTEIVIPLDGVPFETLSERETIYQIPPEKRQNRNITSVLSVMSRYPSNVGIIAGHNLGNDVQNVGLAMFNSNSSAPLTSNAKVELISENTVLIISDFTMTSFTSLRCVIEDDENLASLNKRNFLHFSKLVELAVKSYIYNKEIINLDTGALFAGKELGVIKTIIDGYAESEQMYQEYLTNIWSGVSTLNDRETTTRLIKLMVGGYK